MDRAATFEAERERLFAIAYRMLGSASDAADVLQEAYLRWQEASLPPSLDSSSSRGR